MSFLTAEWNNLVMINYTVNPKLLEKYVPIGTELDFFEGKCFISSIGFMFENVKLLGLKIPFHTNFEEVNLRFYVKRFENGIWKRGAVFIKEIVPKFAITMVANTLYREKYVTLPMKNYYKELNDEITLGYHWKFKGIWNKLEATTELKNSAMVPGSKEEFIAEHYWGYSKYNALTTFEYAVQHPSWFVHKVKSFNIECNFEKLYGSEFAFLDNAKPDTVFMAQGSPIAILHKKNL